MALEREQRSAKHIERFLEPRFHGRRFENGSIPMEFLRSLPHLSDLIVEIAKWEYLKENPETTVVPNGFSSRVAFTFSEVKEGSAIPAIDIEVTSPRHTTRELDGMPPPFLPYYERARESIVSIISHAEAGRLTKTMVPKKGFYHLRQFGLGLHEDESVEFEAKNGAKALLTHHVLHSLEEASRTESFVRDIEIRAYIPAMNQEKRNVSLRLLNDRKIDCKIDERFDKEIMGAFVTYRDKDQGRALIRGKGVFDRPDNLVEIESIETVEILGPLDVEFNLHELRQLEEGWFDGHGMAPKRSDLDWLANAFRKHFRRDLEEPYIYPTIEGGVELEWTRDPWEMSLTIDLSSRLADWHSLNMETDFEDERRLSLEEADSWEWITKAISAESWSPE